MILCIPKQSAPSPYLRGKAFRPREATYEDKATSAREIINNFGPINRTGTQDNATTPTMPRRVEMLVEMQLVKLGFLRYLNSPNDRHLMILHLRQTLADEGMT